MNESNHLIFEQIKARAAALLTDAQLPGAAIGALLGDELFTAGIGVASVENPLPVTADTLFQVGSITKVFTGTLVMRLVELGQLELDAPVQTYLPDFRVADADASATVALRHTLTHTVGWPSDIFDWTESDYASMAAFMRRMPEVPQITPPGAVWTYANTGVLVAGRVIEVVTGRPYARAARELLLEPLGLYRAFVDPGEVMTHRFAVGHYLADEGLRVVRPWPLPGCADAEGGLAITLADLLRFARFHLGDGRSDEGARILSLAALMQMQQPQTPIWEPEEWMGLSWFINTGAGETLLSHGGRTPGTVAELALVPKRRFACAVLINASHGSDIAATLQRALLQELAGIPAPPAPQPLPADSAALQAYVGHYRHPYFSLDLTLAEGALWASFSSPLGLIPADAPPLRCALCARDRLLVCEGFRQGARFDILHGAEGRIAWLRDGDTLYRCTA